MNFSNRKLLHFLAIALLVTAALVLIQKNTSDYDTTALTKDEAAGSSTSAGRESLAARLKLEEVILGKRRVPDSSEEHEAWSRYFGATQKWISQLSIEDCVALLDLIEGGHRHHDFRRHLYGHYGKLDAIAAYKRIAQVEFDDATMMHELCGYVMDGWGSREPAKAWYYYLENIKPAVTEDSGYVHHYDNTLFTIFSKWSKFNPQEAYAQVSQTHRDFYESGISGYYYGLEAAIDFAMEAKQFTNDVVPRKNEFASSITRYGKEWNGTELIAATIATKWATVDEKAAADWWISWWMEHEGYSQKIRNEEDRAELLGLLFPVWCGFYSANQPEQAIQWIYDHPKYLQHTRFTNEALPSIARFRPDEAIELIKLIDSEGNQASLLAELTEPHTAMGQYGPIGPALLLPPELVERELEAFVFSEKSRETVLKAIAARKKFEAEKPVPPPSDW